MKTTDLWFATYLRVGGVELLDYKVKGHRKVEFTFDLTAEEVKKHKLAYMKSTYSLFEAEMSKLKELFYG